MTWEKNAQDHFDDAFGGQYAATYYVDPAGSDSNDGLSPGAAFATYEKGVTTLAASGGDAQVLLKRGSVFREFYEQTIQNCPRIRIGAYDTGTKPQVTAFTQEYVGATGWSA
ncbi:MAG: hypothetical protein AAF916_13185, partial [Planctomycetota bacterium]